MKRFFDSVVQGFFWILPIALIMMIIIWIYEKIYILVNNIFGFIGFHPEENQFLWLLVVLALFVILLYSVGRLIETSLVSWASKILSKVPGYSTLKDIISIFNSSQKGANKVLVVAIKGFASEGFNIGLMYSTKESIIKDHFTVTLSQTPIPNGGYMFEVHKENIFVIEEATFDDNLQYLLSMGVKSLSDIVKVEPKDLTTLTKLENFLNR